MAAQPHSLGQEHLYLTAWGGAGSLLLARTCTQPHTKHWCPSARSLCNLCPSLLMSVTSPKYPSVDPSALQ